MAKLFIELYLDENVHIFVVALLKARDFQALHQHYLTMNLHHAGIIIAVQHSPYEITRRLLRLINSVTADEMQDQLLYI